MRNCHYYKTSGQMFKLFTLYIDFYSELIRSKLSLLELVAKVVKRFYNSALNIKKMIFNLFINDPHNT